MKLQACDQLLNFENLSEDVLRFEVPVNHPGATTTNEAATYVRRNKGVRRVYNHGVPRPSPPGK
jgi:hypothetical protein